MWHKTPFAIWEMAAKFANTFQPNAFAATAAKCHCDNDDICPTLCLDLGVLGGSFAFVFWLKTDGWRLSTKMHSESEEIEEFCAHSANRALISATKPLVAFAACAAFCAYFESKASSFRHSFCILTKDYRLTCDSHLCPQISTITNNNTHCKMDVLEPTAFQECHRRVVLMIHIWPIREDVCWC